ncbi:chondroitinase-B domain-containing protein [Paenibacillus sp. RC67]|uniref:chondroitinase-B domain-containing protein n=1 Tax=Paenibacillus sp. RC67 TaxID=3039392 RepID=UPI0024AE33E9|nr:chondroitinase-B domain-containing protein [Paenibacillus sp. RC67]
MGAIINRNNIRTTSLLAMVSVLTILSLLFFLTAKAHAATVNVSNDSQLASALTSASAGDVIVLADGNYSGLTIQTQGTAIAPIEIKAANQGKAVFNTGVIHLQGANYTTLNGIKVTTSGGTKTVDGKSRNVGVLIEGNNNRITRSTFQLNVTGTTEWVLIAGNSNNNRVDYSEFGPATVGGHYIMALGYQTIPGVTNPTDRTDWANYQSPYNPNMPRYTQIDHNYFHDNSNGLETICLGCAGMAGDYQDTYMVVEYNLFVNCDGDAEIVTIKASNNTVRFNTIKTSSGMLSSRAGNKNSIYGNFMLQGNKSGAGGIKFYEKDHKVYNNYIDGASEYPILFGGGDAYTDSSFGHAQVFRATVVNNTIVNANNRPIIIGHGSNLPPVDSVFANNIIKGTAASLLNKRLVSNTVFSKNIAQGTLGTTAAQSEFWMTDPLFTTVNGLQKLTSSSPAIQYANTSYTSFVTHDMDGQTRSTVDTGADQYSTSPIVIQALTTTDVGPSANVGVNLALGKTAVASSEWSSTYSAAKAVDGTTSTRWASSKGLIAGEWLQVDLGTSQPYSKVIICETTHAGIASFKLQSSNDGTNFTDIISGTTIGSSKTITFNPITSRYIRLLILSGTGEANVNEFEVYTK